ncbi:MAG: ParB/RepB/Spo0J family partition protein [Solirubrobacteraceae bacterium]|nr:ParB/RepB/Spo0J family partition protein [Solirubrobacteraceae bacterium]
MTTATVDALDATFVAIELLDPDHWPNPRGPVDTTSAKYLELKASIAAQGLLEPIVVGAPLPELDGRHAIVAGWRRYTVAKDLGLAGVPVHQRSDITDARGALLAALAENMAREDMTPVAEASAIARLVELGLTQAQAAAAVGVSERTARNRLQLLALPEPVRVMIDTGAVPSTAGTRLAQIGAASPAAASMIAERLANGGSVVGDLFDDDLTNDLLYDLGHEASECLLVSLREDVSAHQAGQWFEGCGGRAFARRIKGLVGEYRGVALSLDDERNSYLVDRARERGRLLELGTYTYITDLDIVREALDLAIERGIEAKRQAEEDAAKARNKETNDPRAVDDPIASAEADRDAHAAAVDERARPHAIAMNAELARRLHGLKTCKITGPLEQLLLHLLVRRGGSCADLAQLAQDGYAYLDPDALVLSKDWCESGLPTVMAHIVRAYVALAFADPRAIGNGPERSSHWQLRGLPGGLLRDVADSLDLLPTRAQDLDAARDRLSEQTRLHRAEPARRRVLLELSEAPRAGLSHTDLRTRTSTYRQLKDTDPPGVQAYTLRGGGGLGDSESLEEILGALLEAKHLTATAAGYKITAAGRKQLTALPSVAPVIDEIDTGPVDKHQVTIDTVIKRPERSVPPAKRRGRVLELIAEHPGITIPDLADAIAVKQGYLYRLLPALLDDGLVRKDGRGWHPVTDDEAGNAAGGAAAPAGVVLVHVTPTSGGDPVEAELQPDPAKGASNSRKVIYTASRTAAWVAEHRITDLPAEAPPS